MCCCASRETHAERETEGWYIRCHNRESIKAVVHLIMNIFIYLPSLLLFDLLECLSSNENKRKHFEEYPSCSLAQITWTIIQKVGIFSC